MEKETLYDVLRKLVNDIYKLVDSEMNKVLVIISSKLMLECLGYSSFLNQEVSEMYRNYIILDCEVVINASKR